MADVDGTMPTGADAALVAEAQRFADAAGKMFALPEGVEYAQPEAAQQLQAATAMLLALAERAGAGTTLVITIPTTSATGARGSTARIDALGSRTALGVDPVHAAHAVVRDFAAAHIEGVGAELGFLAQRFRAVLQRRAAGGRVDDGGDAGRASPLDPTSDAALAAARAVLRREPRVAPCCDDPACPTRALFDRAREAEGLEPWPRRLTADEIDALAARLGDD